MKHRLFTLFIYLVLALPLMAQSNGNQVLKPDARPGYEFVFTLLVDCDAAYTVGDVPGGRRVVIPIRGGTFMGPRLQGTILGGGADYQIVDTLHNRTSLEAIYNIRTNDGVTIHVRNRGILATQTIDGHSTTYFRAAPVFEAPYDSPYAWLNDAIYVCTPEPYEGGVCLNVWKVK